MGWQKASGYNRRALAGAAIGRYKRVIGGALHSRTDDRRATEVGIAVRVLNRMLDLGRPKSIRIHKQRYDLSSASGLTRSVQHGRVPYRAVDGW
jgi:hypothetical protein